MDVQGWEERYRTRQCSVEDFDAKPTPLLITTAATLPPGRALDLACGSGRNAIWLAEKGWHVTAFDGSAAGIENLRERAAQHGLEIDARVADLKQTEFRIQPATFDLILISYYLQRDLFAPAKRGLKPGGILIAIVHITHEGEQLNEHRASAGELAQFFEDCEILHLREGPSHDPAHKRAVAEIVARCPQQAR